MKRTPQQPRKSAGSEAGPGRARVQELKRSERSDWLTQELQRQYRDVLEEPVPEELLAILLETPEETEVGEGRVDADTSETDRKPD